MDEKVLHDLKMGFSCDLFETGKAARKAGEKSFRHTMHEADEGLIFALVLTKQEMLELPDMSEEFAARLKVFNILGISTDGSTKFDMFLLGGINKPLMSLTTVNELADILEEDAFTAFIDLYFGAAGIEIDLEALDYPAFLKAIENEVFSKTSFAKMQNVDEIIKQFKRD